MNTFYIATATEVALFAAMAASFNILLGFGKVFSIAQGAFIAGGAYTTGILMIDYDYAFLPAVGISVLVGSALALLVGLASFRVSSDYLAIATFALQIVATSVLVNARDLTGGASGLVGIPRASVGDLEVQGPWSELAVAVVVLLVVLEICRRIRHSPFGLASFAVGQDEKAARALGKSAAKVKMTLFGLSGATGALVGGFYASYLGFIVPASFDIHLSILLLSMVIIGGAGSLLGPLFGAALMLGVPALLTEVGVTSSALVHLRQIFFALLLLAVVVVLRRGLLRAREVSSGRRERGAAQRVDEGEDVVVPPAVTRVPGSDVESADSGMTLRCEGVRKTYGGVTALDGVSLAITPGRVTGIVGPNGAGKTTLFEVLAGAQTADHGTVRAGDVPLEGLSESQRARMGILRSFQDLRLFSDMSVLANAMVAGLRPESEGIFTALFRRRKSRMALDAAAARAGQALRDAGLHGDWTRSASELSYADQKLLSLARVEAAGPKVIMLDEPASGLDADSLRSVADVVRELAARGRAVCVIEHNTKLIQEVADDMVFMYAGQVRAQGRPDEIVADPALAELYFGKPREVDHDSTTVEAVVPGKAGTP